MKICCSDSGRQSGNNFTEEQKRGNKSTKNSELRCQSGLHSDNRRNRSIELLCICESEDNATVKERLVSSFNTKAAPQKICIILLESSIVN